MCFLQLDHVNVYHGQDYKSKYKAPTDYCMVLKVHTHLHTHTHLYNQQWTIMLLQPSVNLCFWSFEKKKIITENSHLRSFPIILLQMCFFISFKRNCQVGTCTLEFVYLSKRGHACTAVSPFFHIIIVYLPQSTHLQCIHIQEKMTMTVCVWHCSLSLPSSGVTE